MGDAPPFLVELPVFSGPFRLLADLVLDQKIDVCDVPVARITDAFVKGGLEAVGAWSLEEATWFLAMCAVLLELKVGRLLPRPPAESEEDLLGSVSPDLLYARSLELAAFQRISAALAERMEQAALSVSRTAAPPPELAHLYPDVLETVSANDLRAVAADLLVAPPLVDLTHVTPVRATLSDAIEVVEGRLASNPTLRFHELLVDCEERIHVVVRFLAILELYRQGKVELSQSEFFGEIEVRRHGRPRIEVEPRVENEDGAEAPSTGGGGERSSSGRGKGHRR